MDFSVGNFAIVMAHPDDEILWASSLVPDARRSVLCFGPTKNHHEGPARESAIAALSAHRLEGLGVEEAGVFDRGRWPHPKPAKTGLVLDRSNGHADVQRRYDENYLTLIDRIRPRIADVDTVVTHNPWGEHGHEEHVQVFEAVTALAREMGKDVLVTSYVSHRSSAYMRRWMPRLEPATPAMPTNCALADEFRTIYEEAGCWTGFDGYAWPEQEFFYRVRGESDARSGGGALPVNFIDEEYFSVPEDSVRAKRWAIAKAKAAARRVGLRRRR